MFERNMEKKREESSFQEFLKLVCGIDIGLLNADGDCKLLACAPTAGALSRFSMLAPHRLQIAFPSEEHRSLWSWISDGQG